MWYPVPVDIGYTGNYFCRLKEERRKKTENPNDIHSVSNDKFSYLIEIPSLAVYAFH